MSDARSWCSQQPTLRAIDTGTHHRIQTPRLPRFCTDLTLIFLLFIVALGVDLGLFAFVLLYSFDQLNLADRLAAGDVDGDGVVVHGHVFA